MNFIRLHWLWLIPFAVLDLILKGVSLWRASRNNQKAWFIVLFVVNSLGILPVIYLLFFQSKRTKT